MLFLPNPLSASVSAVFRPVHKRHLKEAFERGRPARKSARASPFEARSGVKPQRCAVFCDAPRNAGERCERRGGKAVMRPVRLRMAEPWNARALWMGAFTDFRNESLPLDDRKRARFLVFHGILRGELSAESGGTLFYRGALFAAREMDVDSSIVREGAL